MELSALRVKRIPAVQHGMDVSNAVRIFLPVYEVTYEGWRNVVRSIDGGDD